ncbi:unnamed protein product [Victoria cruziana]
MTMKAFSFLSRQFAPLPTRLGIPSRSFIAGRSSRRSRVGAIMTLFARVQVRDRIELTEKERKIFDRLLQVLRHFDLKTELRVAGGWVRDKLLSKDCYDIDIALDNMFGREFCEMVNDYLVHVGEERQGVGVIQCNPDQSKHLETARMRILDVWIDFVNLRSETYAEHSRIPAMKFGTAEEDAYRRDLTINSLFYNINTDAVEDLTGRGIKDLKEGIISTPLPPKATFLDDPLRVLRAIRFGARFGFQLQEELKRAACDDEVKAAVSDKVSKERIGHEVDLMVSGNQPVKAITYICDLKLFWTVFGLPESIEDYSTSNDCDWACVSYMNDASEVLEEIGCSTFSDDQRRLCLYGALFVPVMTLNYTDSKGKKVPVVNSIFRNSLKLKASDADMVIALHKAAEKFATSISFIMSGNEHNSNEANFQEDDLDVPFSSRKRICAGLLLMEIKELWRVSLLISTLLSPKSNLAEEVDVCLNERVELYRRAEKSILDMELENIWKMRKLLDGKAVMSILGLKHGGPQQKKLLKWQLAHPSGTFDDCADWLRESNAKRVKCG